MTFFFFLVLEIRLAGRLIHLEALIQQHRVRCHELVDGRRVPGRWATFYIISKRLCFCYKKTKNMAQTSSVQTSCVMDRDRTTTEQRYQMSITLIGEIEALRDDVQGQPDGQEEEADDDEDRPADLRSAEVSQVMGVGIG